MLYIALTWRWLMLIPEPLFHLKWQRNIFDHFYGDRLGSYSSYILVCPVVQARQIHCYWCFQIMLVLSLNEFKIYCLHYSSEVCPHSLVDIMTTCYALQFELFLAVLPVSPLNYMGVAKALLVYFCILITN